MRRDPHLKLEQTTKTALMARRRADIARGVCQVHEIFIARGGNAEVWDVERRLSMDFASGIAVLDTGHRHPRVIVVVKDQLDRYTHTCFKVLAYGPYAKLAERHACIRDVRGLCVMAAIELFRDGDRARAVAEVVWNLPECRAHRGPADHQRRTARRGAHDPPRQFRRARMTLTLPGAAAVRWDDTMLLPDDR